MHTSVSPNSNSRRRAGLKIYVAVIAMVFAFVATVGFVVQTASREADRFSLQTELRSTRLEFGRFADQVIRDHSDISYWNDAVDAFAGGRPDMDFVDDELVDLAADHDFAWAAVVKEDGKAVVTVSGDQVLTGPGRPAMIRANADLVDRALSLYRQRRVHAGNGYVVPAGPGAVVEGMQARAFRGWNGRPGLFVAQVILPETEDHAIAEGDASVLLTFRPLDPGTIGGVGRRLGLMLPVVLPIRAVMEPHSFIDLPNAGARPVLAFQWKPRIPRVAIIRGVVPPAILLCVLIGAITLYIVRRHVRTLHALAESEERNRFMANHDALTGLPNRTQFDEFLDRLMAREPDEAFAVMCIDLDRFKPVNDTYGHHAGDAVLRAMAGRFEDVVGESGMVARIGGDEFIVAVTGNVEHDYLRWVGDAFVQVASRPVSFEGQELVIGASVGIAIWPQCGRTARELIAAADRLLYMSKGEGRGRATVAGDPPKDAVVGPRMLAG